MIAASSGALSRHFAHLILFGAWFAVIVTVLLVDHIRERRRNLGRAGNDVEPIEQRELVTAAAPPARISMATWPPPRTVVAQLPRQAAKPRQARATSTAADPAVQAVWLPIAVIGSLAAAAVHLVVMPDHFAESNLYGTFFAVAAATQIAFAYLLAARPSATLLRAGAAGSAAIVALWAFTRLVGVPIGPDNGATEEVGGLDIVATAAEIMVLVACLRALWRHHIPMRSRLSDWSVTVRSLVPVFATVIAVVAVIGPRD